MDVGIARRAALEEGLDALVGVGSGHQLIEVEPLQGWQVVLHLTHQAQAGRALGEAQAQAHEKKGEPVCAAN